MSFYTSISFFIFFLFSLSVIAQEQEAFPSNHNYAKQGENISEIREQMERKLSIIDETVKVQNRKLEQLGRYYMKEGDEYLDFKEQIYHHNNQMLENVRNDNDATFSQIDIDTNWTILNIGIIITMVSLLFGVAAPLYISNQNKRELEKTSNTLTNEFKRNLKIISNQSKNDLNLFKTKIQEELAQEVKDFKNELQIIKIQISCIEQQAKESAQKAKKEAERSTYNANMAKLFDQAEKDNNSIEKIEKFNQIERLIKESYDKYKSNTPALFVCYNNRGLEKMKLGDMQSASEDFNKAVKLYPENYQSYINKARSEELLSNHSEAIQTYNTIVKLISGRAMQEEENKILAMTYTNRGIQKLIIGRYEEAIEDFNQAEILGVTNDILYTNRALTYFQLKQFNKSLTNYNKALLINPNNKIALSGRAELYFSERKYEKALEDYKEAQKHDSENAKIWLNIGIVESRLGQSRAAIQSLIQSLKYDSDNIITHTCLSEIYAEINDIDNAIKHLSKCIKLAPLNHTAYFNRGNLKSRAGNHTGAIEDLTSAIRLKPEFYNSYIIRSGDYIEIGKYKEAIADCLIVLEHKPNSIPTLINLATAKMLTGDLNDALNIMNNMIKREQNQPIYYNIRANIYQNMALASSNDEESSNFSKKAEDDLAIAAQLPDEPFSFS